MPPRAFSIFTSPSLVLDLALTCFSSSRFSGMISFRVALRSGSDELEYVRVALLRAGEAWESW